MAEDWTNSWFEITASTIFAMKLHEKLWKKDITAQSIDI